MYIGKIYIKDGAPFPTKGFKGFKQDTIYEVLKLVNGKPLFWQAHLDRLQHSLKLMGHNVGLNPTVLVEHVKLLTKLNPLNHVNLRISYYQQGDDWRMELGLVRQITPSQKQYEDGVSVLTTRKERHKPNAKAVMLDFRKDVAALMQQNDCWEVLLVDKDGYLTEGSRSNLFFLLDNEIVTAPDAFVLLGITRKVVIEICQKHHIKLVCRKLHVDELHRVKSAFLTGTSPGIILVSQINTYRLNTKNNRVSLISKAFADYAIADALLYDF